MHTICQGLNHWLPIKNLAMNARRKHEREGEIYKAGHNPSGLLSQ